MPPVLVRAHAVMREVDEHAPVVITLSHQSPVPTRAGNEYRLRDMLEALAEAGYRCIPVICPLGQEPPDVVQQALAAAGGEYVLAHRDQLGVDAAVAGAQLDEAVVGRRRDGRAWEEGRSLRLGAVLRELESPFTSPLMRAVLECLYEQLPVHAVVANYAFSAGLLELTPRALGLVDTHDVLSEQERVDRGPADAPTTTLTRAQEARLLEASDVVIAIQRREATVLAGLVPVPVVTCGVSFPVRPIPPVQGPPFVFALVASDNELNRSGLRGFLRSVWPHVLREQPAAVLRVAGRVSDHVPGWAPAVQRMGVVDDPAQAYDGALAAVNPAWQGTGLKIKTLEALSFGKPVVCWPAGADGLDVDDIPGLRVAADAGEMVEHLVRLCHEGPGQQHGLDLLRRETVYRDLLDVLGGRGAL